MPSIDGLVSGLDTASIIEGLVALQQTQVDRLTLRKSDIQLQQAAFQGVEARVQNLRSSIGTLNRSANSVFDRNTAVTSDETILTATASSKAAEGTFSVRVTSLARAHQISSAGISEDTETISQGTISIQVGDRAAAEITIDSSNDSVDGLIEAINAQSDDVSASLVHDQATGNDRILLTSKHTGASNEISVTNNLAAASGQAVRPEFSGTAVQEAANATVQLGSGPGAITAEFESNVVEGLIQGVTLNLSKVDVDSDVVVEVKRDTAGAKAAIENFVRDYNTVISYIDDQTRYNTETSEASPLIGNRNVSNLKNRLSSLVTDTVPGASEDLNRFSQLGVTINDTGLLEIDSGKLSKVLNGDVEGVDRSDVRGLFGLTGKSSNNSVDFVLGSTQTQASDSPYEVNVTQVATRASITGSSLGGGSTVIDSSNNSFQINIDGQESEVLTIAEGTYTTSELASQIQSLINNDTGLASRDVSVSVESDGLKIRSQSYGANSQVSALSGSAIASLGFNGTETANGLNVEGNFIVDGVVETATGSGRLLIGDSSNDNTADLQVRVRLTDAELGAGAEATLEVNRGITSTLDRYFSDFLDPDVGTVKNATEDFDLRIESLDESIARVNAISEAKTQYLIEQFTALERTLSSLQTTAGFLSSQLSGL